LTEEVAEYDMRLGENSKICAKFAKEVTVFFSPGHLLSFSAVGSNFCKHSTRCNRLFHKA